MLSSDKTMGVNVDLCLLFGDVRIAGSKPGTSPIFNLQSSTPVPARKTGADDFLNSESDKNDYDW